MNEPIEIPKMLDPDEEKLRRLRELQGPAQELDQHILEQAEARRVPQGFDEKPTQETLNVPGIHRPAESNETEKSVIESIDDINRSLENSQEVVQMEKHLEKALKGQIDSNPEDLTNKIRQVMENNLDKAA